MNISMRWWRQWPDQIADWATRDTDSAHVVVGPISWGPDDADPERDVFRFGIVKSQTAGLCAAHIEVPDDVSNDVQDRMRSEVIAALIRRHPRPVIHSSTTKTPCSDFVRRCGRASRDSKVLSEFQSPSMAMVQHGESKMRRLKIARYSRTDFRVRLRLSIRTGG